MRGTDHLCDFPLAEEQACLGGEGPGPRWNKRLGSWKQLKQGPWGLAPKVSGVKSHVFGIRNTYFHISKVLWIGVPSPHTVL